MTSLSRCARVGLAAFALGLSLAGPQALGVATADDGGGGSRTAAADSSGGGSAPAGGDTAAHAARGSRSPSIEQRIGSHTSAPGRSRRPAAEPQEPATLDVPRRNAAPQSAAAGTLPPVPTPSVPADPVDAAEPVAPQSVPLTQSAPPSQDTRISAAVIPAAAVPETLSALSRGATVPVPPAAAVPPALRALSTLSGVLTGALAGHGRAAPADPLMWTVLAAASRETFAPAAAAAVTATPSTTSAVAIPETPWLTALRLQYLPIIGPLVVTPIVTAVSQIPIVSDLLHPILGYPVLPEGFAAPRDARVVSFDGAQIAAHFMPASGLRTGQIAPTVMLGSGLGMPGATNLFGTPLDGILTDFLGAVGVGTLRNAGYNVVTWDPRGEYRSGGQLQIDAPDSEARDASAVINWIAAQPESQLDGPGDPRMGMVGPSYGGGIQLVTAAADHRVDAIVPTIAWNTVNSALEPNGAFKSGWGSLLAAVLALTLARTNDRIFPAVIYGDLNGRLEPADEVLLAQRGPGPLDGFPDLVSQISAPTLLIQGTVDTLFSLKQADITATDLLAHGVATKVLWFCGGHGLCLNNLSDPSDGALINQRTLEWLDRYVKGETVVSTGPGFEWIDQRGQHFSADRYSLFPEDRVVASHSGRATLPLIPLVGGSGPLLGLMPIGGTKALNAVDLTTPVAATTTYIVGEPELTLSYSGTGIGDHIYAQLVDDTTGLVLGNQVTPVPVLLDGRTHTITLVLQPVAQTLRPGETVSLQLFAWSADYAASRTLGVLTVDEMRIALPTRVSATTTGPAAVTA